MWHDHLLLVSGTSAMRTRGRALESGQMSKLEPPWGGLLLKPAGSHWCRLASREGLLLKGSSVMMAPPLGLWARHMVHLIADGQFSYVQYSQAHLATSSVIVAPPLKEASCRLEGLSVRQIHSQGGHTALVHQEDKKAVFQQKIVCGYVVNILNFSTLHYQKTY